MDLVFSKCQNVGQKLDELFVATPLFAAGGCAHCAFREKGRDCVMAPCSAHARNDGRNVIFIKVEF